MVGIAGGCPNPAKVDEHVRLGDVVTVNRLGIIEYDNIKELESTKEIRSTAQKPSAKLLKVANYLASQERHGHRPWDSIADIAVRKLEEYEDREPQQTYFTPQIESQNTLLIQNGARTGLVSTGERLQQPTRFKRTRAFGTISAMCSAKWRAVRYKVRLGIKGRTHL